MACSKYTLTNIGTFPVNFNYRRCDDLMWQYQVNLDPNETKNIWLENNSYFAAQLFESSIQLVNDGLFPLTPTPTPSVTPTKTPTPTPSVTPTETPTNTPTPTITETPTNTPTETPTNTPTPTITETPTNTPTPTITETPTNTPTPTPTPQPATFEVVNDSIDVIVDDLSFNGVSVTYVSGDTFPISSGQTGTFSTFETGSNNTLSIFYSATTAGQSVTVSHPFGNPCDNFNTGSGVINSFTFTLQPTELATLTLTGVTC